MSVKTAIAAAAALREVDDTIEALVAEKQKANARIAEINEDLVALRADRDAKILAFKNEAGSL